MAMPKPPPPYDLNSPFGQQGSQQPTNPHDSFFLTIGGGGGSGSSYNSPNSTIGGGGGVLQPAINPLTQYTQTFQQFPPSTVPLNQLGDNIKTVGMGDMEVTLWADRDIDSIDLEGGCGDCIVDKNGSLFIRQGRIGMSVLYEISNLSREEKLMIASVWLKQINQTPKEIPSDEESFNEESFNEE